MLFAAIYLVVMAAVALAIVETAMRFVSVPFRDVLHTSVEFEYDALLGLRGIPGFTGTVGIYHSDISINPQGFRDEDWDKKLARAEETGARKILCIGDSTLYGYRIHHDERFTEALAQRYAGHGQAVEVFNAGMPSYGTGQEFRLLEQLLPTLNPDVVLLRFCDNDFGDSALPYDHRFPHRVYTPFYDLDGNLVLNKKVPRRFSLLVEGTPLERLRSRFAVDRIQYALDDLRFRRHIHLWDTPPGTTPVERTAAQKAVLIAHLDYLVRDPRMAGIFEANKQRNFSLWQRMRELTEKSGAQFVFLHDMRPPAARNPQEMAIDAFLNSSGINVVNAHDQVDPWRAWAEVRGDGHPNGVDNYLSALATYNRLESAGDTPLFSDAPWFKRVPLMFDFAGPHPAEFLFGEWGRIEAGGRHVGTDSHLIVRHDPRLARSEFQLTGHAPHGESAIEPLRVIISGSEYVVTETTPGHPFQQAFPVEQSDIPLAFVSFATKSPYLLQQIGFQDGCASPRESWSLRIGEDDAGFLQSGFYQAGSGPGKTPVRWTSGDAQCVCCLEPGTHDYIVDVIFFQGFRANDGTPLGLRLQVNGSPVDGELLDGPASRPAVFRAYVPNALMHFGQNQLRILSSTFVPAEQGASKDTRTLGILLRGIDVHPVSGA